ncbi:MAG: hypothetical protein QOK25_2111 [Thermoleophilaceae bacterium]|nr:hypothetical protein [Thermoleophilaceae bacterium]
MTTTEQAVRPAPAPSAPSARIGAREVATVFAAGVVLALLATWPLALHLGTRVPHDPGDPLLQAWQVAWDGHAALHQPLHFFQANSFWPLKNSLAFSDALIGYTPAGLLGTGPTAALVRYDLLFLGALALAFAATYLLCRELGAGRTAAAVGGLACAMAPWRLEQAGHLHVLSIGGIPLALFLLLCGYRRGSRRLILAGWLAAAWQVSLGFTLGLQLLYLLAVIGAVVLVAWLRRGRPAPAPGVVLPTAAGAAGLLVVSWVLARPYLQVLNDHPEAHRTLARVSHLSPPLRSLAAASSDNLIWGGATRSVRTGLPAQNEQLLFPGVAIVLVAAAGLGSRAYPVRARRWLAVGVVVSFVFALGFSIAGEWSPYRLLWELAPGWRGIRTPGRVFTLTSLALALLAAAGAQRLLGRAGGGWRGWIVAVVLMSAVAVEGLGPIPTAAAPVAPPVVAAGRAPLLELPSDAHHDTTYEYWSTRGFPALVNGFSGFLPRQLLTLRLAVYWFPDRGSVALLRRMGVRGVVVHHEFARPDRWRHAATASLRGLGLTRRRIGEGLLFRLPAPPG